MALISCWGLERPAEIVELQLQQTLLGPDITIVGKVHQLRVPSVRDKSVGAARIRAFADRRTWRVVRQRNTLLQLGQIACFEVACAEQILRQRPEEQILLVQAGLLRVHHCAQTIDLVMRLEQLRVEPLDLMMCCECGALVGSDALLWPAFCGHGRVCVCVCASVCVRMLPLGESVGEGGRT